MIEINIAMIFLKYMDCDSIFGNRELMVNTAKELYSLFKDEVNNLNKDKSITNLIIKNLKALKRVFEF